MAERTHLFPFRTQKLSFLAPKVLVGTLTGRIGHRRFSFETISSESLRRGCFFIFSKSFSALLFSCSTPYSCVLSGVCFCTLFSLRFSVLLPPGFRRCRERSGAFFIADSQGRRERYSEAEIGKRQLNFPRNGCPACRGCDWRGTGNSGKRKA